MLNFDPQSSGGVCVRIVPGRLLSTFEDTTAITGRQGWTGAVLVDAAGYVNAPIPGHAESDESNVSAKTGWW